MSKSDAPNDPTKDVVPTDHDEAKGGNLPKSQDELNKIIDRVLAPKLSRLTELEGQVETLTAERDAAANKVTAAEERATQLETDVKVRDQALLVKEVSHKKGVREKWLSGETEEELMASADEYLADAKATLGVKTAASNDSQDHESASESEPGKSDVVPSAGTGDETPAKPTYQERLKEAYENAQKEGAKGVTI